MEHARALMQKKSEIEEQLDAQISILKANNCTMETPLVDAEGFPRADIDIYAIRGARVRIIELRNDLKAITNEIGKALEVAYDPALAAASAAAEAAPQERRPFAKVNAVAPGSPAAEADLQREDLVVKFGPLDHRTFTASNLQPLAELVATSENKRIAIKVLRAGQPVFLNLTPRSGWGGRGTLGCHIVPYTPPS
ncbi:putative 26S proteasome non-ATPase, regulatory subunit [Lyophyllum shimeji]|uniref:Probable 26S proteasome regulatory subunit p27 n=1 Tax=Lyophyllum shimeji TaxID=47721 RepID=A0A9P3PMD4_LYOSH|nr:putative 26S proteasome non-ATPase, regulatory subunit [Lyophyllum shimeji]